MRKVGPLSASTRSEIASSSAFRHNIAAFMGESDYEDVILNSGISRHRIILVAVNFKKEVTSTVLWLLNFKLNIQCFQVTPYMCGSELFMQIEQIIPVKNSEDYMIGLAKKVQDDAEDAVEEKRRHVVRRKFWATLLPQMNEKSTLFSGVSTRVTSWIGAGSGVSGITYNFVAGRSHACAELYISRGDKEANERIFNRLYAEREAIQKRFGEGELHWEPLNGRQACRVRCQMKGNIYNEEEWPAMISFMIDAMVRLHAAFDPVLPQSMR